MRCKQIFGLALVLSVSHAVALCQTSRQSFPGITWESGRAEQYGWSASKLAEARRFWEGLPPSSVFVVYQGHVLAQWGDPAVKIKLSSARKSLLSALYGIYVNEGRIDINKTLAEVGMDDDPPLNVEEKKATVKMLLEARSGVYHTFVAGTPAMRAAMPSRGSHAPGTFWYYNNWDFNALGSIFERQTRMKIGVAFRDRLAIPLQMEDFHLEDMYYLRASSNNESQGLSVHPAYHFRLTARDMARFGYLFLRQGDWNGKQIIPSKWISESTASYSTPTVGEGYGYLWWSDGLDLPVRSFSAQGALAKYIVIIPERDLVVVYQNHTELPDDAQLMSDAEVKKLPTITKSQLSALLKLLLDAQPADKTR